MTKERDAVSTAVLGPVTRAEVGRILRVSLTTVDRWKKNGCPIVMFGGSQLNTRVCRTWRSGRIAGSARVSLCALGESGVGFGARDRTSIADFASSF